MIRDTLEDAGIFTLDDVVQVMEFACRLVEAMDCEVDENDMTLYTQSHIMTAVANSVERTLVQEINFMTERHY